MSQFFQQFFEDTCKNVLANHLYEVSDRKTYQDIRLDLADYARLTGVQIALNVVTPTHFEFATTTELGDYKFIYKW